MKNVFVLPNWANILNKIIWRPSNRFKAIVLEKQNMHDLLSLSISGPSASSFGITYRFTIATTEHIKPEIILVYTFDLDRVKGLFSEEIFRKRRFFSVEYADRLEK